MHTDLYTVASTRSQRKWNQQQQQQNPDWECVEHSITLSFHWYARMFSILQRLPTHKSNRHKIELMMLKNRNDFDFGWVLGYFVSHLALGIFSVGLLLTPSNRTSIDIRIADMRIVIFQTNLSIMHNKYNVCTILNILPVAHTFSTPLSSRWWHIHRHFRLSATFL